MNTKNIKRIKTLYELNPEVEEAIDIIYNDVNYRLHNTIGILQDGNIREQVITNFLEGKKDAYFNIQDLLVKIKL